ncbi:MAG: rRNA maturation RNase YbeY [Clostridia bacterium]|nr:rRNA maturation RNase YbeY [Clostridia bacterium]
MSFTIYTEDKLLSEKQLSALEVALAGVVCSDVPLAIELLRVDEVEIRRLNRETRNIDRVTDVLSYPTLEDIKGKAIEGAAFPFDIDEAGNLLLGSVVICEERAREQAAEYGHSYERELHYLLVHGVMHCLGYDHMEEAEKTEMRAMEEKVLSVLGITRQPVSNE